MLPQETNLSHSLGSVGNAMTPCGLHCAHQVYNYPVIAVKQSEVKYRLRQCRPVQAWDEGQMSSLLCTSL